MSSPRLDTVIFCVMADRDTVGQPLAKALNKRLVSVDVDIAQAGAAFERLQYIIRRTSLLVLVISSGFLELPESQEIDGWLRKEFEGMPARVVPLWDNVSAEDVAARMPLLATLSALRTDKGIERCADFLVRLLDRSGTPSVTKDLSILLVTMDGRTHRIHVPADMSVGEALREFLAGLSFPVRDASGERIAYALEHQGSGLELRHDSTFREAGIVSSDRLRLRRQTIAGGGNAVQFSVFHPTRIRPDAWFPLLAYIHTPWNRSEVEGDSQWRLKQRETGPYVGVHSGAWQEMVPGTEIRVVPTFAGCLVEPASRNVIWNGAWQRADFEFQWLAHQTSPPMGVLFFFVGPLLVGEIPVRFESALLSERASEVQGRLKTTHLIQRVFVSYSRKDSDVVDALEPAYRGLGLEYLRDVRELRAGQAWAPELLKMIDRAEAFQLFWSRNAKESAEVEREWRHALQSEDREFIRPMYWEEPLTSPPAELAHLHFAYHPGIRRRRSLAQWFQRILTHRT